ncbi:phage head closure protein [Telluria beijingensis]|uniref:phage head closure protein n=1 Tax=Telluria beijingensis TaxID=3068633 RepID=UPI002795CB76|nr:phage head closure protein [Massilia sp. REN29]
MMNDRVALLKRAAGRDGAGQPVESWSVLRTVWANVKFQSGAEAMRANADVSIVKCSIRIRAARDVDASMRARHQGVIYDVQAVLPDSNDRDFMFLVCESVK